MAVKTEKRELEESIQRRYDIVHDRTEIGTAMYHFVRIRDPDALLDDESLEATHAELDCHPYWAQAWEAAYGVGWALADRDLTGQLILDLGCGLGITGTVAASRGARVVMADHAAPALEFAELNSWPWRENVDTLQVDWRTDQLEHRFDIIVGADIIYDRADLPCLDLFWRKHLKAGGTILLGDPCRPITTPLLAMVAEMGWSYRESIRRFPKIGRAIRLVELEPASA